MLAAETEKILADAFQELLYDKDFERITVADIVGRCSASRTTFYNHFKDKYDLMIWIYKRELDAMLEAHGNFDQRQDLANVIFSFIYSKRNFFSKLIVYNKQNSLSDFMTHYGADYIARIALDRLGIDKLPSDIEESIHFYTLGGTGVVTEWILGGFKKPPRQIAKLVYENIPAPLVPILQ